MKISYEWLREYVNTKIRVENLIPMLTMAGHEVTSADEKGKDVVFDIEVTPNRPDCLCHVGMAREVSAITAKALKLPEVSLPAPAKKGPCAKVILEDKAGCPRYSARIITGVNVALSTKWIIKRIESMGLRPVNNIVDITNFVLFETGQPLHAFDLDKLDGDTIIVRRAKKGEKIVTIDEVERELDPGILVIADKKRPVAIAGVMGGKDTEVTEQTKNILLESAYFDPIIIRRGAIALGISTDSNYRFERGIDLAGVVVSSDRAASLISGIAKGCIGSLTDAGVKKKQPRTVPLRPARVNKILGTDIDTRRIKEILARLGFKCKGSSNMEVAPPSFRNDVMIEADLIEEIARIYGYENIPCIPPAIITTDEDPAPKEMMEKRETAKVVLASLGFNEVITYSLISAQAASAAGTPSEGTIEIRNPLSKEQEIMRQSLLPGMLKAVSHNVGRQIHDIRLFELSNIYFDKENTYNEEPFLTIAQYARPQKQKGRLSQEIFQLKGAITELGNRLGITRLKFESTTHPVFVPDETMVVLSGDIMLGAMGRVRPEILEGFDIKAPLYCAELNFKTIADSANLSRFYKPLPRFPYSYRDVSFALDEKIAYKEIYDLIKSNGGLFVEDIELLSEYRGKDIPKGQRALAFRIVFRSQDRTLKEEEINSADQSVRDALTKDLSATLR